MEEQASKVLAIPADGKGAKQDEEYITLEGAEVVQQLLGRALQEDLKQTKTRSRSRVKGEVTGDLVKIKWL